MSATSRGSRSGAASGVRTLFGHAPTAEVPRRESAVTHGYLVLPVTARARRDPCVADAARTGADPERAVHRKLRKHCEAASTGGSTAQGPRQPTAADRSRPLWTVAWGMSGARAKCITAKARLGGRCRSTRGGRTARRPPPSHRPRIPGQLPALAADGGTPPWRGWSPVATDGSATAAWPATSTDCRCGSPRSTCAAWSGSASPSTHRNRVRARRTRMMAGPGCQMRDVSCGLSHPAWPVCTLTAGVSDRTCPGPTGQSTTAITAPKGPYSAGS
jgi:hypothetical protein